MAKRIYHVKAKHGAITKQHLIRAHSIDAAIRKASEGAYQAHLASQDTLVEMMANGHKIVDAGAEQLEIATDAPVTGPPQAEEEE